MATRISIQTLKDQDFIMLSKMKLPLLIVKKNRRKMVATQPSHLREKESTHLQTATRITIQILKVAGFIKKIQKPR